MSMDPQIMKNEERAVFALRSLYSRYGYEPYKMSRFEEYDLYVRNKDFLVSDQIITFADRGGKLLALKPDVTLSIIKYAPEQPGLVQKVYYNENVYRTDRSTRAFKEIMQAGLECVGDLSGYEIAEVLLLAVKSLELLAGRFVLDISHMGLLDAVMDGLDEAARSGIMECLRQKNSHELRKLCQQENIGAERAEKLAGLIDSRGNAEQVLAQVKALLTTEKETQAFAQLEQLCAILAGNGYADRIRVDFSVGSDMKYYSGVVFKGYLEGIAQSVLSGGQYDKLLRTMGRSSGAVGFAIYTDLLQQRQDTQPQIDTLILRSPNADPAMVVAAAEQAAGEGTVLVAVQPPEGRTWRRVVDLRGGAQA